MSWKHVVVVLLILGNSTIGLTQENTPPRKETPEAKKPEETAVNWMQIKLRSSQEILAALTRGEMAKVEVNARRLLVTNILEQWARKEEFTKKSEYEGELNRFEFATKELIRFGRAGDIDGSLNAYQSLCRSCVECHKLIRDK